MTETDTLHYHRMHCKITRKTPIGELRTSFRRSLGATRATWARAEAVPHPVAGTGSRSARLGAARNEKMCSEHERPHAGHLVASAVWRGLVGFGRGVCCLLKQWELVRALCSMAGHKASEHMCSHDTKSR